jgi:tryptophan synthase alpha chain
MTSPGGAARVDAAFDAARREGRAAFIGFLTAGFPDPERFRGAAETLLRHADLLEVGLPFSDPLGDGPTVQRASETALRNGVGARETLELVSSLRERTEKPLVVMTYYNPIYCYEGGEAGFIRDLAAAGGDGLILPDLPPDEGETLTAAAWEAGLGTTYLVAPTSTDERLRTVVASCRGFVYAVSVTGVTGVRESLPPEVPDLVARTRVAGAKNVAVGFGVANADTARTVAEVADGVVVGSAIVKAVEEGRDLDALARELRAGCER